MKTALPAHLRFLMLAVIILSSCITPVLAFYHPEQGRWINRDPIEETAFFQNHIEYSRLSILKYMSLVNAGLLPPYLFVLNNPVSSVDADGLDIALTDGNKNASWWQVGNRFLHQEICVDTWVEDPSNPCSKKKSVRRCFSFAATGLGFNGGDDWLDRDSCQLGGPLQGEVYDTGDQGRKNAKSLKTTCEQDEAFLKKLEALDGRTGAYSLLRHSCRSFSQMMFDEASASYGQSGNAGGKGNACEWPKK